MHAGPACPRRLVFRYRPSRTRVRDILAAMRGANMPIADLTTHEADLEDIFLELTRNTPKDGGPKDDGPKDDGP